MSRFSTLWTSWMVLMVVKGDVTEFFFAPHRSSDYLSPALLKEMPFLTTPIAPLLFSTPTSAAVVAPNSGMSAGESLSQGRVSIRKRRRLAASPGGLHWNSAGKIPVSKALWRIFQQQDELSLVF